MEYINEYESSSSSSSDEGAGVLAAVAPPLPGSGTPTATDVRPAHLSAARAVGPPTLGPGACLLHVYVEVHADHDLLKMLERCLADMNACSKPAAGQQGILPVEGLCSGGADGRDTARLHISLSRPVVLKRHHLPPFLGRLSESLRSQPGFRVGFSGFECFVNDTQTRSFMALLVGHGADKLGLLLGRVNECLAAYGQAQFYENPRFHASFAYSEGAEAIRRELADVLDARYGTKALGLDP
ncbi:poly(U)-specific 3'-to-5' RNA exonuclease, partial [Spiromyces aspiralis]